MGTAEYISPEQVKGKRGDVRSDLYALGIMLYEMLTGETPFRGSNPFVTMNARLKTTPVPLREMVPDLSPQLDFILSRALERNPNDGYTRAREFAYDLEHQDQIRVAESAAPRSGRKLLPKRVLFYGALAILPLMIFALMLYVARLT
jgi:serine/threonine-protein kinase